MNTCAECRFWKDVGEHRAFYDRNPMAWRSGEWKECTRAAEESATAFIAATGADDYALMTRSDFGCVQFEALYPEVTTEKPGYFKTTFRTART